MKKYFLRRHEASRLTGDFLVHAFSPTEQHTNNVYYTSVQRAWAPYCAQALQHFSLPGHPADLRDVTCVLCVRELMR